MNDLDLSVKRYLERRGEMGGGTLFRVVQRGGGAPSVPGAASVARDGELSENVTAKEAIGSTPVTPADGSERPSNGNRVDPPLSQKEGGGKNPADEPSEKPAHIRREYLVEEPVKRKPEAAQADLFGDARDVPAPSELSGLDLAALEERVATCTLCPLCEGRTRTVFGTGDPKAKLVFIGEAPGREEDLRGEPFVGRAGQLLTKILASVGFTREEVYITNILKCRPPDNRDPNEKEVRACKPYLKRQIELLDPVLICALGRVAGQNLLERNASLSVLRQHIHYYEDVRTIVTYHPAALLRNPNLKRAAWDDIQETRKIYDEALRET